jgi:formylglycine-generating enzyme required for sulfatase activity
MVMEYFQAMSLSEYVSQLANAKEHDFRPIFTQILDALDAVHQRSQVHRDLKPSNVLINAKEQIRLIDFGLVKGGGSLVSVSGKYLGTPGYTAPEQEIDSAMADARSDIYSMGGLMYYCTSGGKHPPRVVFPNAVPEAYREQILTCLNEMQEERYQNAGELRRALSAAAPTPLNLGSGSIASSTGGLSMGAIIPPQTGEVQTFDCIDFVYCPAGTFMMGSNEKDDEQPVHEVEISRGFWLGKYPVTQGQWEAVMGNNPSKFKRGDNYPVERVRWDDTRDFIDRLNEKQRAKHYRLSTESEWEYGCRGGSTTTYCFGDDESKLKEYAWFDENSDDSTHPVGKKRPNDWGLYDMHGNVWEWVNDWYAPKNPKSQIDPVGPSMGSYRVLRGGGWGGYARGCRSADRYGLSPGDRHGGLGFRLLRITSP